MQNKCLPKKESQKTIKNNFDQHLVNIAKDSLS